MNGPILLLAAARLVVSGSIGQSQDQEPIPWTDCAWCVADESGDVHLPGGWKVPSGTRRAVRETNAVPGTVLSDGEGHLFYFYNRRAELGQVEVGPTGLSKGCELARLYHWDLKLHVAPASCRVGFATGDRRFFALDRRARAVHAWTEDGGNAGVVFSFAERKEPFVSMAIHPGSGDLLLGTGWPENTICRFRADGTEVKNPFWPAKGYALSLGVSRSGIWVLGSDAMRLAESKARSAQCRFGQFANVVHALAETPDGYWLATSQGAQFYHRNDLSRCAWRVGGVTGVGALALHEGRVLAGAGYRMLNFWLDDQAGDVISSDDTWRVAKKWNEKIDLIEVRDDVFHLRDATSGGVTAFDPRVTEWVFRARRQYDETDFTFSARTDRVLLGRARAYEAVAGPDGIRLCHLDPNGGRRLVQTIPAKATALAAEGAWLVAYEPARKAIVRYRLSEDACEDRRAGHWRWRPPADVAMQGRER